MPELSAFEQHIYDEAYRIKLTRPAVCQALVIERAREADFLAQVLREKHSRLPYVMSLVESLETRAMKLRDIGNQWPQEEAS